MTEEKTKTDKVKSKAKESAAKIREKNSGFRKEFIEFINK